MSLITAKAKIRDLGYKAQQVVDDETLSVSEKSAMLDAIQKDLDAANEEKKLHDRIASLKGLQEDQEPAKQEQAETGYKSIGQQAIESAGYKQFIAQGMKGAAQFELKAANTIDEGAPATFAGSGGLGGQVVTPQFLPGIVPLKFQPLTIADLFAQGTTTAPAVTYVVEAAFNDNTATVAEKGTKPQLDLSLARRQDNVSKIANTAKMTDEMLQDAEQFEAYLTNRMIFGVKRAEEAQLLNGNGTAPNLQGIMNRPGLAPTVTTAAGLTAVKAMEAVFNQITALRTQSFVEPDAVVMNPQDWQTIRLGKDANGQYYGGGPFTGAYGNSGPANVYQLWGLRVVVTSAMPQGTALVGGFQECGQIFRRTGITVEMTNSNVDDFVNNLITLRAEERLALAVYRPAGFGKVTLTA